MAKKDFQDFIEKKNITDGKNYNCSYVVQNMVVIQASSWMKNLRGAFFAPFLRKSAVLRMCIKEFKKILSPPENSGYSVRYMSEREKRTSFIASLDRKESMYLRSREITVHRLR